MSRENVNEVERSFSLISNRILRGMFFRKDGSLNWFGYVALLLSVLLAASILSFFGGCVNIYTRCPTTDARIERVYQNTGQAAAFAIVASFPQMMSDSPSESESFRLENCLTIPFLGLPIAVDAVCEACLDTVFFPCDHLISNLRRGDRR